MKTDRKTVPAFTLIEMMVTILIASIVVIAISGVLASAHRDYRKTYDRVYGDVITQAYTSRIIFDRVCRKSSRYYKNTTTDTDELYVYYFSPDNDTKPTQEPIPDRYAYFYTTGGSLMLDQGSAVVNGPNDITLQAPDRSEMLAVNVKAPGAVFLQPEMSNSIQMILTLDDGEQGLTVTSSSVRHN